MMELAKWRKEAGRPLLKRMEEINEEKITLLFDIFRPKFWRLTREFDRIESKLFDICFVISKEDYNKYARGIYYIPEVVEEIKKVRVRK